VPELIALCQCYEFWISAPEAAALLLHLQKNSLMLKYTAPILQGQQFTMLRKMQKIMA
jgi:hypothetical protein